MTERAARPRALGRDLHGLAVACLGLGLAVGTTLSLLIPATGSVPVRAGQAWSAAEAPAMSTPPRETVGVQAARPGQETAPSHAGALLPLDINRADGERLQALPGIGPVLAQRIIAHREAHGPFGRAEGLLAVPGIGPKRFAQLRPLVRVGEGP